jgi:hypothetical protein
MEQNNNIITIIEEAYRLNLDEIIGNEIEFKKGRFPKIIRKLNDLKKIEISDSNIEEIKYYPPNIEELTLENCLLTIFESIEAPQTLRKISFENNFIQLFIDGNYLINLTELNLSSNKLELVPILPESIKKLDLNSNSIKKIENIENLTNLIYIDIGKNLISELSGIPKNVQFLNISKNKFTSLNLSEFKDLKEIKANFNEIEKIDGKLNENIIHIDFSQNNLEKCPIIPRNIKYLDLSFNKLKYCPILSSIENLENLEIFDICSNDDLILTEEVVKFLIRLKSNINMCMFDQFQIDEEIIDGEIDGDEIDEEIIDKDEIDRDEIDKDIKLNVFIPSRIPIPIKRIYNL